jgi:hypothetical protein
VSKLVPPVRQRAASRHERVVDAFAELYEERALAECADAR